MNTVPNEIDHQFERSKRLSSNSKKKTLNRIQIYSKASDQSQNMHLNSIIKSQQLYSNQESKVEIKRIRSMNSENDQQHINLLKLMQEQLQMSRIKYEEKIKQQLMQNSQEVAKLQSLLNANNQILNQKDKTIHELFLLLKSNNNNSPQTQNINSSFVSKKISDCEVKLNYMAQQQEKLKQSIVRINHWIEKTQKGFVKLFACKFANLEQKISNYAENTNQKLIKIQELSLNKNQSPKQQKISNQVIQNLKFLTENFYSLKNQARTFKTKQFLYENQNIDIIKNKLSSLSLVTNTLQKKLEQRNFEIKTIKRKGYDSREVKSSGKKHLNIGDSMFKPNEWSISQFSDYERVYQQLDSIEEDQFFHSQKVEPFLGHNDSFQNFTSDEDDEDTPNQKRLIQTIKEKQYKIPVHLLKDLTGKLILKKEGIYLLDKRREDFRLNELQLNRLQHKGFIII